MPSTSDPQLPTSNHAPVPIESIVTSLTVEGTLPTALTGRYVRIGPNPIAPTANAGGRSSDGMVQAVQLHAGGAVSYRNRRITTDHATNVITFAGRTLALGRGALAHELDENLATIGPVDLAGHGRGIGAHPQLDPLTGALHIVSYGDDPAHHTVAATSHTRSTTYVPDAPRQLEDLLVTRDRFVLLGEGFVGITDRSGAAPPAWVDAEARGAVAAHDVAGDVAVLTTDGSLARWHFSDAGARREVLDDTPQTFGTTNGGRASTPTYLWTVAANGTEVYRHDLRTSDRTAHDLGPGRHPGAMTFVPDPTRRHREDGGWLIGLAHDDDHDETALVVLDAAVIDRPPVASVRIPRRIAHGRRGAWIPAT